ncbi:DEHA2B11418p [Debaryomyces hansenii CBS767]|uniref:DEHA2B11418p n=1 Tax=Debaryomyces hansenii (strain ATCC 36239 / CBS 767 / BCRC 21394 / JCM 1990 / NBRC 0083 / IGC 2968) TaxID=284592 RepID=Q6BWH1_DEBHA|nr:DEHA2B11418p [Debaryomyces hansenii CBS767]CAG85452.1 DEHA2B11418p [Debaryomyces hansenii CBS767]|eukprot:XP_457448.1 DEHA2B11418p [Debaryomyces hansenii CBS767]
MTQVGDGKWCKRKDREEKREEITASVKGTAGGGFVVVTEHSDAATRYQSIADVMGPVLRGCDVASATSTPKRGLAGERNCSTRIGHTTSVLLIVRRSSP